MKNKQNFLNAITSVLLGSVLMGCGGGDSSTSSNTSTTVSTAEYPSGVSTSSPTSVSASSGDSVVAQVSFPRFLRDYATAFVEAVAKNNKSGYGQLLAQAVPIGSSFASPSRRPEGQSLSDFIDRVASGRRVPDGASLPWTLFFDSYTAANCYGPSVSYQGHDDAGSGSNSGTLPGGDTGMWLSRNGNQTTGKPCSAAQLDALLNPIKRRTNAVLLLGARMKALAGSNMPTAGNTLDLSTSVNSFFQTLLSGGAQATLNAATITNNSGVYTYFMDISLTVNSSIRRILLKVVHNGNSSNFSGLASYLVSNASNTCASGSGVLVNVGTLRYIKSSSTEMNQSVREAPYCANASSIGSDFSTVVALTSDGELDPSQTGSATDSTTSTGWSQNGGGFKRFGSTINPSTHEGNYKFAWQAGVNDSHSRMFAMNISYNTATEVRTGQAFFGFSDPMSSTGSGSFNLLGMICNWAGPGNSHTPNSNYQYQKIVLGASSTEWDISTDTGANQLSYAPTNNCNSSASMTYDVDANGTIASGEGSSVTNALDTLDSGTSTIQGTIEARGFSNPNYF
jgi:hypothetical protein